MFMSYVANFKLKSEFTDEIQKSDVALRSCSLPCRSRCFGNDFGTSFDKDDNGKREISL